MSLADNSNPYQNPLHPCIFPIGNRQKDKQTNKKEFFSQLIELSSMFLCFYVSVCREETTNNKQQTTNNNKRSAKPTSVDWASFFSEAIKVFLTKINNKG